MRRTLEPQPSGCRDTAPGLYRRLAVPDPQHTRGERECETSSTPIHQMTCRRVNRSLPSCTGGTSLCARDALRPRHWSFTGAGSGLSLERVDEGGRPAPHVAREGMPSRQWTRCRLVDGHHCRTSSGSSRHCVQIKGPGMIHAGLRDKGAVTHPANGATDVATQPASRRTASVDEPVVNLGIHPWAGSSMVEQRTFNPWVEGSSPSRLTPTLIWKAPSVFPAGGRMRGRVCHFICHLRVDRPRCRPFPFVAGRHRWRRTGSVR